MKLLAFIASMLKAPSEDAIQGGLSEYEALQRAVFLTLTSSLLLIAFSVLVQFISGSLALGAMLIDSSISLLQYSFNLVSIGIILRQNPFSHPYGTGKLENFAGFLYAMCAIPGALWILFSAYSTFMRPPAATHLGLTTLPLLVGLIRSIWLYRMMQRIVERCAHPSPMTLSLLISNRVGVVQRSLLLTGVLIGFGFSFTQYISATVYFDIAISSIMGLYMLNAATRVLIRNFRSLIDLPLPEADQMKVLQALTAHFEAYEDIGNVYTQLSGSTRLVQIELYVKPETSAAEIQSLSTDMEKHLKQHFGKLLFHLIPLVKERAA